MKAIPQLFDPAPDGRSEGGTIISSASSPRIAPWYLQTDPVWPGSSLISQTSGDTIYARSIPDTSMGQQKVASTLMSLTLEDYGRSVSERGQMPLCGMDESVINIGILDPGPVVSSDGQQVLTTLKCFNTSAGTGDRDETVIPPSLVVLQNATSKTQKVWRYHPPSPQNRTECGASELSLPALTPNGTWDGRHIYSILWTRKDHSDNVQVNVVGIKVGATNGSTMWSSTVPLCRGANGTAFLGETAALDAQMKVMVVAALNATFGINTADGAVLWTVQLHRRSFVPASLAMNWIEPIMYLPSYGDRNATTGRGVVLLHAIDTRTGRFLWNITLEQVFIFNNMLDTGVFPPLVVTNLAGGVAYAPCSSVVNPNISFYNGHSGQLEWTVSAAPENQPSGIPMTVAAMAYGPDDAMLIVQTCSTDDGQNGQNARCWGGVSEGDGPSSCGTVSTATEVWGNITAYYTDTGVSAWNTPSSSLRCSDGSIPADRGPGSGRRNMAFLPGIIVTETTVVAFAVSPMMPQYDPCAPLLNVCEPDIVNEYRSPSVSSISVGFAMCTSQSPELHATFQDRASVTIANHSCSEFYKGTCNKPYTGSFQAKCCWDTQEQEPRWVLPVGKSVGAACQLPSVPCPDQDSELRATFGSNISVPAGPIPGVVDPGYPCTASVYGTCNAGLGGSVQAKCCLNTAGNKTKWIQTGKTSCYSLTDCPVNASRLNAQFPWGFRVPQRNGACLSTPYIFGTCDAGYEGSPKAQCCWNSSTGAADWTLVTDIATSACKRAQPPQRPTFLGLSIPTTIILGVGCVLVSLGLGIRIGTKMENGFCTTRERYGSVYSELPTNYNRPPTNG